MPRAVSAKILILGTAAAFSSLAPRADAARPAVSPSYFDSAVRPMIQEYCLKCHSTEKQKGDLDLEQVSSLAVALKHPKIWQAVIEQISNNEMPPKDKPQPSAAQKEQLLAWAQMVLEKLARENAGDPGPVVLRRLSNAEYTYTIRDITGVDSLDPVREFPVDSAAGEGFMNVGNSLVISPSLLSKYLDASKSVASHAILLPDGIRFSSKATRRDWTEEILTQIRDFYRQFTDPTGGDTVNLQGIVLKTNEGGRLPLENYLAATLEVRESKKDREKTIDSVARAHHLSPKYLTLLMKALESREASLLMDPIREQWRHAGKNDVPALGASIANWQKALWKFSSVGHIGKAGGPKAWMEPLTPIATQQDVRFKIPTRPGDREVTVYLVASDAGDGNENDEALWEGPRLVKAGRPDIALRDIGPLVGDLTAKRERLFASTARFLAAADEVRSSTGSVDAKAVAKKHGVDPADLALWLDYLGIGSGTDTKVEGHLPSKVPSYSGYEFVKGWASNDLPNLAANSSDQHVRIPGNMKPHSVAVHPTPTLAVAVGWKSPVAATVTLSATIQHAHPECGNGVTWSLEMRRGAIRKRLANGVAQGPAEVKPPPIPDFQIQPGDLVSILIGPRDRNHSCDLTAINLTIRDSAGNEWDLGKDVSPDVLAGNPHADRLGHPGVWHFYAEPDSGGPTAPPVPPGSLLTKWLEERNNAEREALATKIQNLLRNGDGASGDPADAQLLKQLSSFSGPLLGSSFASLAPASARKPAANFGIDPATPGLRSDGHVAVHAPSVLEVRLPADLAEGSELVATGRLESGKGREGSVQFSVSATKPAPGSRLIASSAKAVGGKSTWTDGERPVIYDQPIIVADQSAARSRIEADFESFRQLFPAALCYTKIVPVDEVVTLTLYYREDQHLARLMLTEAESRHLDRLWDELHFISRDALTMVDVFEQLWQYATQDADPKVFEPMREPIKQRAAEFRKRLVDTEPQQLDAVVRFADLAYRHPLTNSEKEELRGLYARLRKQEIPHEEAIRMTLSRILVSPSFLYHAESPGQGTDSIPISSWELANRLSFFLWSSAPDAELRAVAASGKLREPKVLAAQAHRMMKDPKVRRLATEFGCAWLHIYEFDQLSEKSERHFPEFQALRGAMYEESIRFFTDLFQRDGSVLNILNADYTFVNESLARHYEIPGITGNEWRRVEGARKYARGGILAQASVLSRQSGASRTSPILRGNWVSEVLLGEKLPKPPKDVPRLPEDETATDGLTVRQLVQKHTSDPSCFNCHKRIDPFGFSLEAFDAIGRRREKDLAGRPIDTKVKTMDGAEFADVDGLRQYLLTTRRDAFLKQFCRKLLGYSLGRGIQLSDGPLIDDMVNQLKSHDFKISTVVDLIIRSRQFREIRGSQFTRND